jgi:hypothetical protein
MNSKHKHISSQMYFFKKRNAFALSWESTDQIPKGFSNVLLLYYYKLSFLYI